MLSNLKKRKEGFTIIEVMIVLAIAGLIMLIVFLAVPALQRNSRNTQRKNDISAIAGGVNEWMTNNAGKVPTVVGDRTAALGNAELGYYDASISTGAGSVSWASGAQNTLGTGAANDKVVIVTGAKCDAGGVTIAGSSRQIAMQYQVETSGNNQPMCQEG